jgi:hypothetical protein
VEELAHNFGQALFVLGYGTAVADASRHAQVLESLKIAAEYAHGIFQFHGLEMVSIKEE